MHPPRQNGGAQNSAKARQDSKALLQDYADLENQTKRKEQLTDLQAGKLQQLIQKIDTLHQRVEKPKEHAADARAFEALTGLGLEASCKLAMNGTGQSIADFVRVLKARYIGGLSAQEHVFDQPEAFHWHVLDVQAERSFAAAPGVNCMLGPMEAQQKVRKAMERKAKRPVAPLVRPEELHGQQDAETDKQETDRNMEEMWSVLGACGSGGCPVAELICNHKSFAQTVENLFTLSFLVRDHKVELWHDEVCGMCAKTVAKKQKAQQQQQQQQAQSTEQLQFVTTMTMTDWETICLVVKPEDCKMKHREKQDAHEDAINQRRQQQGQQQ